MDYEPGHIEHVRQSDLTVVIPSIAFHKLHNEFGDKVQRLPQLSWRHSYEAMEKTGCVEPPELSAIPRPRLGYIGNLAGRVSVPLLHEVLLNHPEWQFLSVGDRKWLPLPNEHVVSWRSQSALREIVDGLDIGFMPYDCADAKNLHCVPLKLFDYFAKGIPVVSTPIVHLSEYKELVYLGATGNELAEAISAALSEPAESPKRAKRKAIARSHSVESLSPLVAMILEGVAH
jgi:hypothetical protein